jgi:hypothetical protein
MPNIIRLLRSITAGNRPAGKTYGEPYVNLSDNQIGVFDSSNVARDLVGVPYFSAAASYPAGQPVNQGGALYVSRTAVVPGAFNPAQWGPIIPDAGPASDLGYYGMQVNGSAQINQQALGSPLTIGSGFAYFTDGWRGAAASSGAVFNCMNLATPIAFPPAFDRCVRLSAATKITAIGVNDYAILDTPLEGYRVSRCGFGKGTSGSPVTIAFWAYSDAGGTASVAIRNGGNNRSHVKNFTLAAATPTWVVLTFPPCPDGTWTTDTSLGMELVFCFACGSAFQTTPNTWATGSFFGTSANTNMLPVNGNSIFISGLMALVGSIAPTAAQSPAALRQRQDELLTAQRYLQYIPVTQFVGYGHLRTGGTAAYLTLPLSVPMRIQPTLGYPGDTTLYSGDSSSYGSGLSMGYTPGTIVLIGSVNLNASIGANGAMLQLYEPSSALAIDARL